MSWYRLRIDRDDNDTFMVTSPDFPEVATFGEDLEDAMRHGRDAIEEAVAARISDRLAIPAPCPGPPRRRGKGHRVQLSALSYLKASLYMICKSRDISRAELARRLGWHREQVDRLFRLDHNSRLDQLEAAFKAVGVDLPGSIGIPMPEAA
jgi:antitoxin HicB